MDSIEYVDSLEMGAIIIGLVGGLALFLYGMDKMAGALRVVAGGKMKRLLAALTTNRFMGAVAGAFVTMVVQSSSVTTVLVIGFITAGLMTLQQSIGVIMGANIGSTITAQIIAFKITRYALVLIALGFALPFLTKRNRYKHYGTIVMGIGLIFFGMELMSQATTPLRAYQPFVNLMHQMDNPLLAVLAGAFFTGLIQSSAATTGVIIVLAGQGLITLEAGIGLAFGANIGTCVTAILAAIGKPRQAMQAATIHVMFNVVGVIFWLGLIDQLAALVRWITPAAAGGITGMAKLAAETPRQIANAHTIFNLVNTLMLIWFVAPLAKLVQWLIPVTPSTGLEPVEPKYLDDILLETPELALDRVRLELGWLGTQALRMVKESLPAVLRGTEEELELLAGMDDDVDRLYGSIVTYLSQLFRKNLLQAQARTAQDYMAIANHIENIGDMIETNLVEAGQARLRQEVQFSYATQKLLGALHARVLWSVERALESLANADKQAAEEVMAAKLEINQLSANVENHLARRLIADEPNRFDAFRLESEIVEYLKRMYYFAKRIAKVVADVENSYKVISDLDEGYEEVTVEPEPDSVISP